MTFYECGYAVRNTVMIIMLLEILFLFLLMFVRYSRHKQIGLIFVHIVFTALLLFFYTECKSTHWHIYENLPVQRQTDIRLIIGCMAVSACYMLFDHITYIRKYKNALNATSVKEALDNLTSGICFYNKAGLSVLENNKMTELNHRLFCKDIQSLNELRDCIKHPNEAREVVWRDGMPIVSVEDNETWRFAFTECSDKNGDVYTQVIATDISELRKRRREIERENERLKEMSERTKKLHQNMQSIIREEETLAVKIRVHDDIGRSIISAKQMLNKGADAEEIRRVATAWADAIDYLHYINRTDGEEVIPEKVYKQAEMIGVSVNITGEMPADKSKEAIILLAVGECATNCVRHAGGKQLFVEMTEDDCRITTKITNDGRPPQEEIVEGGGLSGLRRKVESAGGQMTVTANGAFELVILLPKGREKND